jgi:glycosyltransferase involved in cell wall biosynthesis
MPPLVSIITPTYGRDGFLKDALRWVQGQTYPNLEWLVLDDSPEPSRTLSGRPEPRLRYQHVTRRLSIGEKRNLLIDAARGEYIAHFDDDDYYAPRFVETMVANLEANAADFANLNAWYLYDLRHDLFGFWNLRQTTGLHYECHAGRLRISAFTPGNNAPFADNYLGYGFTYVYRKAIWEATPYAAIDWGEDQGFARAAAAKFQVISITDHTALVLHVLHPGSSSACFPQYHLPGFLVPVLFGECAEALGARRRHAVPTPPGAG